MPDAHLRVFRGSPGEEGHYDDFDVPVEELVFFVVIPICGLLTLEAVRSLLGRLGGRRG